MNGFDWFGYLSSYPYPEYTHTRYNHLMHFAVPSQIGALVTEEYLLNMRALDIHDPRSGLRYWSRQADALALLEVPVTDARTTIGGELFPFSHSPPTLAVPVLTSTFYPNAFAINPQRLSPPPVPCSVLLPLPSASPACFPVPTSAVAGM